MWITRLRRRMHGDAGVTLAELLVTMTLMGVVGAIIVTAVVNVNKLLRSNDNESQGLGDVRTVSERLARDIRDARSVDVTTANASQLTLWIDSNSDYRQESDETITWHLVAGSGAHYNVVRSIPGSADVIEARTLVNNLAFSYCTAGTSCVNVPTSASAPIRLVTVFMTYQAVGTSAHNRNVTFQTRLRNVA